MIVLVLSILVLSSFPSYADVFSKTGRDSHSSLEKSLNADAKDLYHKRGLDLSFPDSDEPGFSLRKDGIRLGSDRFDLPLSLKSYIQYQIHSNDVSGLSHQLANTPFLFLQYSSPAIADLLKHYDTMAHLQVAMRLNQVERLENNLHDPLSLLHQQAVLDCLKKARMESDINKAMEYCIGLNEKPLSTLNDPRDGWDYISSSGINVTKAVLERVAGQDIDGLQEILSIVPQINLGPNLVYFNSPALRIRQLMAKKREYFMDLISQAITSYKHQRSVQAESLNKLSVVGFPIGEQEIKQLCSLNESQGYLMTAKISSRLAYLKTMDLYSVALGYLSLGLKHPAISTGYKKLIEQAYDFVFHEKEGLKQDKEWLEDYFSFMGQVLDYEDEQKLKVLQRSREESIKQEIRGLFNLDFGTANSGPKGPAD